MKIRPSDLKTYGVKYILKKIGEFFGDFLRKRSTWLLVQYQTNEEGNTENVGNVVCIKTKQIPTCYLQVER
jgi:hypothetical protein